MLNRREFSGLAGATLFAGAARAAGSVTPFYASAGPLLTHYDLDAEAATLTPRSSLTLPAALQYAWPAKSRRFLYVVLSGDPMGGLTGPSLGGHRAIALAVDSSGALTP